MFSNISSTTGSQCQTSRNQYNDYCERSFCDMCGTIIETGRGNTKDNLYLCSGCFYRIDSMRNNIIQSSITRFFTGNVL